MGNRKTDVLNDLRHAVVSARRTDKALPPRAAPEIERLRAC
jgi:hypothetical protein